MWPGSLQYIDKHCNINSSSQLRCIRCNRKSNCVSACKPKVLNAFTFKCVGASVTIQEIHKFIIQMQTFSKVVTFISLSHFCSGLTLHCLQNFPLVGPEPYCKQETVVSPKKGGSYLKVLIDTARENTENFLQCHLFPRPPQMQGERNQMPAKCVLTHAILLLV